MLSGLTLPPYRMRRAEACAGRTAPPRNGGETGEQWRQLQVSRSYPCQWPRLVRMPTEYGRTLGGQRAGATRRIGASGLPFRDRPTALLVGFADADDGDEADGERHQGFLGDIVVGFAEKLAAFGVADNDVTAPSFR